GNRLRSRPLDLLWLDRQGDVHEELGAAAVVRLDPAPAVHAPDELPADVQAQPCAADAARHARAEPIELLEDAAALARRDPESLVGDRKAEITAGGDESHGHGAAVGRVLDGVLDHVLEHL